MSDGTTAADHTKGSLMNDIAVTVLAWIGAIWLACALTILGAAIYVNRRV